MRAVLWIAVFVALVSCRKAEPAVSKSESRSEVVERLAAAVITIAHADVEHWAGTRPKPNRTKPESLDMATEIAAAAKKEPSRFRELAASRSEDPFGAQGGELPAWTKGEDAMLDGAVAKLAIGAISDPVDTEYGYRIFMRLSPLPAERISARHLVVAWAGATRAPRTVTRTKTDAMERARELVTRARHEPNALEALIQHESDGWDKERGGRMGQWTADGGRYPVSWDRAIVALTEGAISDPVESEFGYQIFQRVQPAPEAMSLAGAHVLISFRGAEKARADLKRTREQAEMEAKRVAEEARANPSIFGQLAAKHSDDASGRWGGDLGAWKKGDRPAAIDEKLGSMKIGEVSDPVLTPFGYHVLLRREAPSDKPYVAK